MFLMDITPNYTERVIFVNNVIIHARDALDQHARTVWTVLVINPFLVTIIIFLDFSCKIIFILPVDFYGLWFLSFCDTDIYDLLRLP